jgi:hypothetical protein
MTDRRTALQRAAAALLGVGLLWIAVPTAQAHLVNSGFGPFYDGLYHLALSPDELLICVGLAALAGLRGKEFGRMLLTVLPVSWFIGGCIGLTADEPVTLPFVTTAFMLAIGALVASDFRVPYGVPLALAIVVGGTQGYLNGSAVAGQGAVALIGIVTGVFVTVVLLSAFVVTLKADWMRVAVRVAGSWIAAIGLLMLGWAYRGAV